MGSMTYTRTHFCCSKEFKVSGGDTFIGAFIACYKLTVERGVHLYTVFLQCLALARALQPVFQKPLQLDMIRVIRPVDVRLLF